MSEDKIKELEKQIEELKKGQLSPAQKNLLDTLDVLNVKQPSDLKSVFNRENDYEEDDEEEYEDEDEQEDEDEDLRSRMDKIEEEKAEAEYRANLAETMKLLSGKILENKSKYPYLAANAKNAYALKNMVDLSENFYEKTGKYPDIDQLFVEQNKSMQKHFEDNAEALGISKEALKIKIEEDNKELKEDEKGQKDDKTEKEGKSAEKEQKTEEIASFKIRSAEEVAKMPKIEQFQYMFDEAEAKQQGRKLVKDTSPDPTEDKKTSASEDAEQTPKGKIVLKSGGTSESTAPATEKTEEQSTEDRMKEAGFE